MRGKEKDRENGLNQSLCNLYTAVVGCRSALRARIAFLRMVCTYVSAIFGGAINLFDSSSICCMLPC